MYRKTAWEVVWWPSKRDNDVVASYSSKTTKHRFIFYHVNTRRYRCKDCEKPTPVIEIVGEKRNVAWFQEDPESLQHNCLGR